MKILPILFALSFILTMTGCPDPSSKTEGYVVIYSPNYADGGTVPAPQTKTPGEPLLISDNTGKLSKEGFVFYGWNSRMDGEGTLWRGGDYYKEDAPITIYADWADAATTCWIRYDGNGADSGTTPRDQPRKMDDYAEIADNTGNLAKEGYVFSGWNKSKYGDEQAFKPGSTYTGDYDLNLYAVWEPVEVPW